MSQDNAPEVAETPKTTKPKGAKPKNKRKPRASRRAANQVEATPVNNPTWKTLDRALVAGLGVATLDLIEFAAKKTHEANRAYCASIGDDSQTAWEDAPDWQRASAIAGVTFMLESSAQDWTPAASHESWLAQKEADGWVYGETKDAEAKTHPCMVPYEQLPAEQRAKDELFGDTVAQAVADWTSAQMKEANGDAIALPELVSVEAEPAPVAEDATVNTVGEIENVTRFEDLPLTGQFLAIGFAMLRHKGKASKSLGQLRRDMYDDNKWRWKVLKGRGVPVRMQVTINSSEFINAQSLLQEATQNHAVANTMLTQAEAAYYTYRQEFVPTMDKLRLIRDHPDGDELSGKQRQWLQAAERNEAVLNKRRRARIDEHKAAEAALEKAKHSDIAQVIVVLDVDPIARTVGHVSTTRNLAVRA